MRRNLDLDPSGSFSAWDIFQYCILADPAVDFLWLVFHSKQLSLSSFPPNEIDSSFSLQLLILIICYTA